MTYRMACHQADKATASHWLPHPQFYLYFFTLSSRFYFLITLAYHIYNFHSLTVMTPPDSFYLQACAPA